MTVGRDPGPVRAVEVLQRCGARQEGLASARQLAAAGLVGGALARAVRAGAVVRVRPGVYGLGPMTGWPTFVVTDTGPAPAFVAQVRAVLLSLGPSATACGPTAACLRGWGLLREPVRTTWVARTRSARPVRLAGVHATRRRSAERELWRPCPGAEPLWTTTAVQTVLDCCRTLPLDQAVVVVDSALRSRQVDLPALEAAARRLPGRRGAARVRRALLLCDPESGSVLESVLRVAFVLADVSGFATQVLLTDAAGRRIRRVDFCFAAARLVVETDGRRWHPDPHRDRSVDNRLVAAGWRVLRLVWSEVVEDTATTVALVQQALASGREVGRSEGQRPLHAA